MATETIEMSLYNDTIKMVFYPNSHQYKIDGRNIMSVTTACGVVDKSQPLIYRATNLAKSYLMDKLQAWQLTEQDIIDGCMQHKVKKEEAGDIWSIAHERAERYIKEWKLSLPDDERVQRAINGFLEWERSHNVKFIQSEKFVYSKEHDYIGIADCIAEIDGKKYLIDFKTSNSIYLLSYWMQTSAYLKAYEEETGDKLHWIIIVKFAKEEFDKNGDPIAPYEIQEIHDIDGFFDAFIHAKKLKEYVKKYDTYK